MNDNLISEYFIKLVELGDEDSIETFKSLWDEIARFHELTKEAELQKIEVLTSQFRGINNMLEKVLAVEEVTQND
jgi:hypothetical protein